jgi:arylsulfatase A-like enzyme
MYRGKKLASPKSGDWDDTLRLEREGHIFDSETGPSDPDLQDMARMGYYAAMTQIDYEIGRLYDAMFSHGLDSSNTVLVFVSDHGEMLCDHGLFRKSLPFEGSAKVPLIVSASRDLLNRAGFDGNRAHTAEKLAELRDVMPTILALCGVEIPETVDGCNLLADTNEYIHGEHLYDGQSCQWIVTDHDKFVWFSGSGRRMYFDLDADPDETCNAVDDDKYSGRAAELEQILIRELAWREEGFVKDGKLTPGAPCRAVLTRSKREIE